LCVFWIFSDGEGFLFPSSPLDAGENLRPLHFLFFQQGVWSLLFWVLLSRARPGAVLLSRSRSARVLLLFPPPPFFSFSFGEERETVVAFFFQEPGVLGRDWEDSSCFCCAGKPLPLFPLFFFPRQKNLAGTSLAGAVILFLWAGSQAGGGLFLRWGTCLSKGAFLFFPLPDRRSRSPALPFFFFPFEFGTGGKNSRSSLLKNQQERNSSLTQPRLPKHPGETLRGPPSFPFCDHLFSFVLDRGMWIERMTWPLESGFAAGGGDFFFSPPLPFGRMIGHWVRFFFFLFHGLLFLFR